jgi:hypothetical protein
VAERSITGDDRIDELDRLATGRGYPAVLRQRPRSGCVAVADWAGERIGLHFPPGIRGGTATSSRSPAGSAMNA